MKILHTKEGTSRRKLAAALLGLVTACLSVGAGAATLTEMSPEERNLLVNEMNVSASEVGRKGFFYYDDPFPVSVSVSLDVENNYVIVNLDEKLGPRAESAETEDLLDAIRFSILSQYDRVEGMMGIRVLYGGKPSTYWFPEPSQDEPADDDRRVEPTQGIKAPVVAITGPWPLLPPL